ncbi:MAG: component of the polarisome [Chaenotheca gracillima]|nr:MAG: component of the polarisome [Chaenotheca gracillima]
MNGRAGPLSPVSTDGSEWSAVSRYQSFNKTPNPSYPSPNPNSRLVSPPISNGSSSAMNGAFPDQMNRGGGQPSPPSSVARSSDGVGQHISRMSGQSRKGPIFEDALQEHHAVLKKFLAPSLRGERGNPRPNRAKDKLLRLSSVQFQELSTDVFDELLRRQSMAQQAQQAGPQGGPPPGGPPPYLLPKNTFHPKRNQARQKLSSLPPPRFRELSTDVFFELERRYPRFIGGDLDRMGSPAMRGGPGRYGSPPNGMGPRPGSRGPPGRGPPMRNGAPGGSLSPQGPPNEYGRPLPKTFQSNTIIPNKSTLVEDDDDQSMLDDDDIYGMGDSSNRQSRRDTSRSTLNSDKKLIADYQAQVGQFQERISELENNLHQKDEDLSRLRDSERDRGDSASTERREWSDLRSDLEGKVSEAQSLNDSLQSELDRVRADNDDLEHRVRQGASSGGDEWRSRFDTLQRDHSDLQVELREQQQVTEEVRQEATHFLNEMKVLSDQDRQSWEKEEQLVGRIDQLEKEAADWKSRYARTKTQMRNLRASSIGLSVPPPDAGQYAKDGGFASPNGLVKDVHVTKFQIAIDELLRIARSGEPVLVLDYIKSVVMSVRYITHDITSASSADDAGAPLRNKLKARVSATANNLTTAAKNFAASNGISPISLLDAAASHLTSAVVELVRAVKIRPTPAGELEEDEANLAAGDSPGFFPIRGGTVHGDSVYSALDSSSRGNSMVRPRESWSSRQSLSRNGPSGGKPSGLAIKPGFGLRETDSDLEELKIFLENQTEALVRSIQSLVGSIRADGGMPAIRNHISDISVVVQDVVSSTEHAMDGSDHPSFRDHIEPVVGKLSDCRTRLLKASSDGENVNNNPAMLKDVVNKLPPLAFEIARETKELVQRIDQLENDGAGSEDDHFR